MRLLHRRTNKKRILVQAALLGLCFLIIVAVRAAVEVDTLSDPVELALNSTALVVLLASVLLSVFVTRAAQTPALRARMSVVSLLVVGLAIAFVRLTYADVSIELADMIEPAQAAEGNTQIVIGPTGDDVRLSGDIREGAANLLESILTAHPAIERIHLTSEGGLADEGQALADVIAAHRLTTFVPDYCVSACTLAFVGGRERLLMDGARLGFHAPYQEGVLGQTFAGDAKEQRAAYINAGLSADFIDKALKVAPDDLWIPDRQQLLAAHVATGYVDRYRFPDSILDGAADSQGARDAVLRSFSMLKSIDVASPLTVDRIADWYLQAYRRGASEGAATDGLKTIVNATLILVLARADDATLVDLARVLQAANCASRPHRDCETIGESVDLVRATAVLSSSDKEADARAENLIAKALATSGVAAPASGVVQVAFAPRSRTCVSARQAYVEAVQDRDPTALRRLIRDEAPGAAHILAPLVTERR